jgi:hypothetical protein
MGVYPFELDDSYPISAGFAHRCARGERLRRRAAGRYELAPLQAIEPHVPSPG